MLDCRFRGAHRDRPCLTVDLTANGVAPVVTLAPASVTFADTTVGATSAGQTVTLPHGPGSTAALNIASITLAGTNPGDFAIVPGNGTWGNCSATLAIGASCTFDVTFTPAVGGARSASAPDPPTQPL